MINDNMIDLEMGMTIDLQSFIDKGSGILRMLKVPCLQWWC